MSGAPPTFAPDRAGSGLPAPEPATPRARDRLPTATQAWPNGLIPCPWCGAYAGAAQVSLDDLFTAFAHRELERPTRQGDGTAGDCTLTSRCPDCERPFMVALAEVYAGQGDHASQLRLVPVRTAKDAALLRGDAP